VELAVESISQNMSLEALLCHLMAVGVAAAVAGTHGRKKKSNREIHCRDKSGSNRRMDELNDVTL